MKLFAAALYAKKDSFWGDNDIFLGVGYFSAYDEPQAKEMALEELNRLRPKQSGWDNYNVYILEIPPEKILFHSH